MSHPPPSPAELGDRLHSLAIHLLRRVRPADAESGLSAARLSALSVLVFGGACGLGELADAEQVSAPTMSRLVTALEGQGLVRRTIGKRDARRVRVTATAAGRRALHRARAARIARLAAMLEEVDPARRCRVLDGVEILEAALAS